ncbi:hypothetical protein [Leptospira stimsonii]|uniref:Uncharacterized protein n=1 Tax=Leptospira stimsonii TaxID=2202203 RepID=A0A8B3CT37_9LEPT|nr:hypothetical protein [Leptospira stimsonii]RHX86174.1 hypothetical protein DLM78_09960 [Leptospira stimsonii]
MLENLAPPRLGELRGNAHRPKGAKTEQWNSFVKVQSVGAITKGDSFSQVSLSRDQANFAETPLDQKVQKPNNGTHS